MPIDEKGFLGQQIHRVQEDIRSRHHELFDMCMRFNVFGQRLKYELEVPVEDRERKAAACFFIRVLNGIQAVVILPAKGLASEAAVVLRSVYEAFLFLKAVRDKPGFVDRLLRNNDARRLKDMNWLLNAGRASLSAEQLTEVEAEVEEFKGRNISDKDIINVQELAPETYSLFRYWSAETHPALYSVSKYLQQEDTEGAYNIDWGPSEHDIELNLVSVCTILCDSMFLVVSMFGLEVAPELASLHAGLSTAHDRLISGGNCK